MQGKSSAALCKLFFPREQADTFLCSTEVVQSVIRNTKGNRAIHYCQRKAGKEEGWPKTSPEGSTERGLALPLQHQAQARLWKDSVVIVTRGLSIRE